MKRCRKVFTALTALVVATAAGCGGEETGEVVNDVSKDEKLLKAMGGYMEKRQGSKPAAKKAP